MIQHYKDQTNRVYELEDASFAYLLPAGCVPITPEELEAILQAALPPFILSDHQAFAQSQIDSHYETLYKTSVINSAIAAEYEAAYESASKWLLDTTTPVPERVKALAETYGVSNTLAANVVVTKWTEAQTIAFDLRGAARLRAKLAIRTAVNKIGVDQAITDGMAAMEAIVFSV